VTFRLCTGFYIGDSCAIAIPIFVWIPASGLRHPFGVSIIDKAVTVIVRFIADFFCSGKDSRTLVVAVGVVSNIAGGWVTALKQREGAKAVAIGIDIPGSLRVEHGVKVITVAGIKGPAFWNLAA
jgi:hypothetical protein